MKLIFVISPRTHFLDLAGPDQVFSEAIFYKAPFELVYCTYAPAEAGSASGLQFANVQDYKNIIVEKGDYIFIPGMDLDILNGPLRPVIQKLMEWMRQSYKIGANLCSVCTGAFVLAATGILNQKICTTHWKYTKKLQQLYPTIKVQENVLFTEKDGIFTSAGIASGIDLALYIVEKEMGAQFAHKVAREIVVYIRRAGHESQESIFLHYRNHIHTGIHTVQDYLIEHLDKNTNLAVLADIANMSLRNFTRIFKKETGITIGDYVQIIRKEKIKELIKKPDLSKAQIANKVGLDSVRQLNRMLSAM
jgi:transcriptional regulator GlxA family with amidase domain